MTPPDAAAPPTLDQTRELKIALGLTGIVLATLVVVKPLGGIPYIGAVALTIAALMQLALPLYRADILKRGNEFVGLHLDAWRRDLKLVLLLMAVTFPPYVIAHYFFMIHGHDWALRVDTWLHPSDLPTLAPYFPRARFDPGFPRDAQTLGLGAWWLLKLVATHAFGVALPEETFYRGYLQPRLEHWLPPKHRVLGVKIGWAAVFASFLFALGHFLGEWNPLRLGPFLPGLVFAWQRNATGSVAGAITYHAACNLLSEILSTQYAA